MSVFSHYYRIASGYIRNKFWIRPRWREVESGAVFLAKPGTLTIFVKTEPGYLGQLAIFRELFASLALEDVTESGKVLTLDILNGETVSLSIEPQTGAKIYIGESL
jgi:hypothetical protein